MFYEYQKKIAEKILKNTPIQTVYCDARQVTRDKDILVAYKEKDEFIYIGLDDTKGLYSYIRQYDNIKFNVSGTEGCNYLYIASVPIRIVICGVDSNLNSESVAVQVIMSLTGLPTQLNQIISDSDKLFLLENKVSKQVIINGVYCALDIILNVPFSMQYCKTEIYCTSNKNALQLCDFVN